MRICKFIEGSFMPSFDGASQKFENITKQLSNLGVDLTVVHCYRAWSDINIIKKQKYKTYAISPRHYYHDYSIINNIIGLTKPDIIEMNDMELLMSTGLYINKKFKIPLVFDAHFVSSVVVENITKNKTAVQSERVNEKFISKIISGIICFTETDKNDMITSTGIKPQMVKVLPLGSNTENVHFRRVSKKDIDILFLGNMFFQPNQEAVDEIVNDIAPLVFKKNNKLVFKFIGDVPKAIKDKYQCKRIKFLGRVKDINEAFKNTRICIVPVNTGGGMRVKILTYMASGIPIISTKTAAVGITNCNKFLNIANTPTEFANSILGLVDDLPKSLSQGKRAYQEALNNYSWRKIAENTLDFYKTVLKNPVFTSLDPIEMEEEPFWLTETIEKGRFKKTKLHENRLYFLGYGRKEVLDVSNFIKTKSSLS